MFRKILLFVFAAIFFAAVPGTTTARPKPLSRTALRHRMERDIRALRDPTHCYIQAGFPHYTGLFGRDSLIISWELMDYNPGIARCTLETLAKFQGGKIDLASGEEPGKILHEWHRSDENYERIWPFPYYGSADSTPLFIYVSGLYFEKTCETVCDLEWLRDMWPHIEAALAWCETRADIRHDGFIEYELAKGVKGLFHQGWKDADDNHIKLTPPVAMVEIQGYYYAALIKASNMAYALGKTGYSQGLSYRAAELKARFVKAFWIPEKQQFAFALDANGADPRMASNQGQILFSGILDDEPEKAAALARSLFAPDMWTPFGIRTLSTKAHDYNAWTYHQGSVWPHDNWVIAQGLKRLGFAREYSRVKNAQIATARIFHGKIPELYFVVNGKLIKNPEACTTQGWSSGGLLNFLLSDE